jgi:glycosyltransferase involved in cell wall biosynthesis
MIQSTDVRRARRKRTRLSASPALMMSKPGGAASPDVDSWLAEKLESPPSVDRAMASNGRSVLRIRAARSWPRPSLRVFLRTRAFGAAATTMSWATHDRRVTAPSGPPTPTAPENGLPLHVVCLSPQSWEVDLPTNRQQVMARIGQSGHRVLYVETGGFIGRHLRELRGRGWGSLFRQMVATEAVAPGVRVMKAPNLLPWGHRSRRAARVNSALTARTIRRRTPANGETTILWLYDPCFAGCVGKTGERFAVYDCVDDYAEQAAADTRMRSLVAAYDGLAASRSRLVFATAKTLVERHRKHNPRTHLVPNVGNFTHFAQAADRALRAGELATLPRPVVGFAGNFLPEKVDFELLEAIALRRPEWTVLLVGPSREGTEKALRRLSGRENVRWLGPKSYEDIPRYVAAFDVGIIPYLRNAYTQSCFPLKTFEYLAAGKAVVASGLPELDGMEPHVVLAENADRFIAAVEEALAHTSPSNVAARQELAAANTWETRTHRLLELIAAEL